MEEIPFSRVDQYLFRATESEQVKLEEVAATRGYPFDHIERVFRYIWSEACEEVSGSLSAPPDDLASLTDKTHEVAKSIAGQYELEDAWDRWRRSEFCDVQFSYRKLATRLIGRDAGTGQFISVDKARGRKTTAVVQRIKLPNKK